MMSLSGLAFGAVLLGGIHALIPNHWIPLVLMGRSERWTVSRLLGITALAGLAHTASTILIGFIIGWFGIGLADRFEFYAQTVAPAILIALGVVYLVMDRLGRGGHHHHHHDADLDVDADEDGHTHEKGGENQHQHQIRNRSLGRNLILIGPLLLAMFLSPCLEIEAYYLTAAGFGWTGIILLSLIYLALTVGGMLLLVYLSLRGIESLNWHYLEHHEKLVTGLALVIIGAGVILTGGGT